MSSSQDFKSNSHRHRTEPHFSEEVEVARRGGLSSIDYPELMDNLENSEQTLIEHLRTAGLKKTRECQLIDELLNLRKSRRQAFALLTKDVTNTREYQEEQKQKSKRQLSQLKQVVIELQNDLDVKDSTLRNIQHEFKKKLEDAHLKYRQMVKDEVSGVRASYEVTLSQLESKIDEVQNVTSKNKKVGEEEQAQKLQLVLEENNHRQKEKYTASMQRYVRNNILHHTQSHLMFHSFIHACMCVCMCCCCFFSQVQRCIASACRKRKKFGRFMQTKSNPSR
jgi:hypothetical protein